MIIPDRLSEKLRFKFTPRISRSTPFEFSITAVFERPSNALPPTAVKVPMMSLAFRKFDTSPTKLILVVQIPLGLGPLMPSPYFWLS